MQIKPLFFSAVVAFPSASMALEHEHQDRSPQNDNFGQVPSSTRRTTAVLGPLPAQELLIIPQIATELVKRGQDMTCVATVCAETLLADLTTCGTDYACVGAIDSVCPVEIVECPSNVAARQSGGGSPFDNDLQAQSSPVDSSDFHSINEGDTSSDTAEPSYSIAAAPTGQLEQKDDDHEVVARAGTKISEIVQSAMPADVKKALVSDPKVVDSLANAFSGTKVPQWYAKLPASVTNYYATITTPPTMTGTVSGTMTSTASKAPGQNNVDDWVAKISSYKSALRPELSAMSAKAVSESREAKRLNQLAVSASKVATKNKNGALMTTAWSEYKKAATMSHDTSSLSAHASQASAAVFSKKKHNAGAPLTDKRWALGSSVVGAVVCVGIVVAL